jgi:hypothetical protein
MTARSEVTPEEIERLLPAYRRLLRMARENQAAAETLPSAQKDGTAPSNAVPVGDVDLHNSAQELTQCPPQANGAEAPPKVKAVAIPPDATAPSRSTSTADIPLSSGEAHGA